MTTSRKIPHARASSKPNPAVTDPLWDDPAHWADEAKMAATRERSVALTAELDRIRAKYEGAVMRARLLQARIAYAADLLERGLGTKGVREGNREWLEDLWLTAERQPTLDWERWRTLISIIASAARRGGAHERVTTIGPVRPEPRGTVVVGIRDAATRVPAADGGILYAREANDTDAVVFELDVLSRQDPEWAMRLDPHVDAIAAVVPLWRTRRSRGGRAKKEGRLWETIREIGVAAGLAKTSHERVRDVWKEYSKLLPESDRT